uniref:Interleukin-2 receptor subunit alpha n=1 Tax=Malurus cyaneus samueli TaxID=2593467 RepID=A0A8C5UHR5_9PASS
FADDTTFHALVLGQVIFSFLFAEKCPRLPVTEFADVTAEKYPLQTKLYYVCDPGYYREGGALPAIKCESEQRGAFWKYGAFKCFDKKNWSSTAPTMEVELTQKPEREPRSPAPQKRQDLSEPIPHASMRLPQDHYVGQVLYFKCQSGYDKRPPTSGSTTCKKVDGKIIWTPLDMRCTNDSNQWPPQTAGPGKVVRKLIQKSVIFLSS